MSLATITKPLAVAVIAVASLFATQSVQAAPGDHLDRLAVQLQSQSRDLIGEFRLHYAHTQEYRHLVSDAYSVYRLAGHIHLLAHNNHNLHHVESDLRQLDRLLHHLHGLVDHREIHPHGGHVHGNTGHVHALLSRMEATLHHMQSDVRQLNAHDHVFGGDHGFGGHGGFSRRGSRFSVPSRGLTIRNGRISLHLGR